MVHCSTCEQLSETPNLAQLVVASTLATNPDKKKLDRSRHPLQQACKSATTQACRRTQKGRKQPYYPTLPATVGVAWQVT
jgi:hypothetical protein